jgi:hypothetical protein
MTEPVRSSSTAGPTYEVTDVAGHEPSGLDDFVGATTVTVSRDGETYRLVGAGLRINRAVQFHLKETGSALEGTLVWTVVDLGDGRIVAMPPAVG